MSQEDKTLPVVSPQSIETSPSIGKIIEAMSKAQSVIEPAKLDMENSFYKKPDGTFHKYASLASVQEAYKKPLAENSLVLMNFVFTENEKYFVKTMIAHTSGEWIASTIKLLVGKQDMQGLGSAITYARRYGSSSILGIIDSEDDDGNASLKPNGNNQNQGNKDPQARDKKPSAQAGGNPQTKPPIENHAPGALTQPQLKRMYAIGLERSWSNEYLRLKVFQMYNLTPSQLSKKQYDTLCENFEVRVFNAKDKAELDHLRENMSPANYEKVLGKKKPAEDFPDQMPDYDNQQQ